MSMDSISILALHGYHGSAQALRRQFAPDKPAWTGVEAAVSRIRPGIPR